LFKTYPVYASLNSPTVTGEVREGAIKGNLISAQYREYLYRRERGLPFSFYIDGLGKMNISHRNDWNDLGGLG